MGAILLGCTKSNLSNVAVSDPSLLQVNIVIHRRVSYDGNTTSINAYLKDKAGRTVANQAIQIRINGQALRLNGGSSNYYGAFPYYELPDTALKAVGDANTYTFTMVLADGAEHVIGTCQAQPDPTASQLELPKTHSRRQPLLVQWQGSEMGSWWSQLWRRWQGESTSRQLTISKVQETKDQWGNTIIADGSRNQADYLMVNIGTGQGSQLVPLPYFKGPQAQFNALSLLLRTLKTIRVGHPFRAGSDISSEQSAIYRIDIVD